MLDCHGRLVECVRRDTRFLANLKQVRDLGLRDGCIGAGALRNLVWDALSGRSTPATDVDVVFFDDADETPDRDRRIERELRARDPSVPWEVTNQAGVHRWFESLFGHAIEPLRSIDDAVASWPEFATCVAVAIDERDRIRVIAPYGLDDLFSMTVRRNPRRVSLAIYRQRIADKRYGERWPDVTVVDDESRAGDSA